MRKYLSYSLIIIYLFSFSEVRELLKLPNLIEHYISHTLRDPNTTLFSFIKIHYLDEQTHDRDYNQDMKLPFKTHSVVSISPIIPPNTLEFNFQNKKVFIEKKQYFVYSENFYPSIYQNIWQPPKV